MSTETHLGEFQLGGAQLPANPETDYWQIDSQHVEHVTASGRTWRSLTLTIRATQSVLEDRLKHLQATAGKYDIVTAADGAYQALDRSRDGGVIEVVPPETHDPPRVRGNYVVDTYRQRPLDHNQEGYEVQLELVAVSNRSPDYETPDEARGSDEWGFAFRSAQFATRRVAASVNEGTKTSAPTVDLTLVLEPRQAKVLEESATRLAAVSVREVPDGENVVDDDSPTGANSVVITTPDNTDPITEGEYAVLGWETLDLSRSGYRVAMTVSPIDLARSGLGFGQLGGFQLGGF